MSAIDHVGYRDRWSVPLSASIPSAIPGGVITPEVVVPVTADLIVRDRPHTATNAAGGFAALPTQPAAVAAHHNMPNPTKYPGAAMAAVATAGPSGRLRSRTETNAINTEDRRTQDRETNFADRCHDRRIDRRR